LTRSNTSEAVDSNRLAYAGGVIDPLQQAALAHRWGWWFYAEYRLVVMRAYLRTIALTTIGLPLLYLGAMGVGLGALVDAGAGGVDGVPYLVFVLPGLLVSSVVMESGAEFTYPVMAGFKWQKFYHGVAATPVTAGQIVLGEVTAVGLRFLLQSVVFWAAIALAGGTTSAWSLLMAPIATLAALAFGAPLMAWSATQEDEGAQFAFVQRFVVMPLFLFGGTFYPLESMPGDLQWIGWVSPMWHGTQLARWASFGLELSAGAAVLHLSVLLLAGGLGIVAAMRVFTRRLAR
jgi:lipooligosaccharide transport system permease protein